MANLPRPFRHVCTLVILGAAVAFASPAFSQAALPSDPPADTRPLSPAQIALFETPHLRNVSQSGTLGYQVVREGAAGFTDTVAMHVRQVNPDGTKDLSFDFLTGPRRVAYPELDQFRGNPILMLMLERDVLEMKQTLGLSATYFRNRIRESFVEHATVAEGTFTLGGRAMPARLLTVRPFAGEARLERLPSVQQKTYVFVLADGVPGMIAEMRIAMPANPAMQVPAFAERITFQGVAP